MNRGWTLAVALASGCSEDAMPMAELAQVCGQDGPAQILPLATDEVVNPERVLQQQGGRTFYGIRRFDHPISNVQVTGLTAEGREYAELDARIESIDRCGDDRRIVAEGVDALLPRIEDDEPSLAYRSETRELFWIDLESRWAPRAVLRDPSFQPFVVRGHRIWQHDETNHRIVRHTLADDAVAHETVFENVRAMSPRRDAQWGIDQERGELLVLHEDGLLVAMDFETTAVEPISDRVGGFMADPSHRWLLLWDVAPGDALDDPTTSATLFDRELGIGTALGTPGDASLVELLQDVVTVQVVSAEIPTQVAPYSTLTSQFIALPGLQSITLDGEWRIGGTNLGGVFAVYNWMSSERRVYAVDGTGIRQLFTAEFGDVLRSDDLLTRKCRREATATTEAQPPCDILSIPYATGIPEVLERRVWSDIELSGDRWLAFDAPPLDLDHWRPDPRGDLVLIDGITGARSLLDTEVSPELSSLEPHEYADGLPWRTDEIVYQVRDLTGDRTGLWRARFE